MVYLYTSYCQGVIITYRYSCATSFLQALHSVIHSTEAVQALRSIQVLVITATHSLYGQVTHTEQTKLTSICTEDCCIIRRLYPVQPFRCAVVRVLL